MKTGCLAIAVCLWAVSATAQQPPSAPERAVAYIANTFQANPLVTAGERPAGSGSWFASKTLPGDPPALCQGQGAEAATCLQVIYRYAAPGPECHWTVLVPADAAAQPAALDENTEAARLTVRAAFPSGTRVVQKSSPPPIYPAIAKAAHIAGEVRINILVDPTGAVKAATVVSGPPMLTGSALEAAKASTFDPVTVGSQPVAWRGILVTWFRSIGSVTTQLVLAPDDAPAKTH